MITTSRENQQTLLILRQRWWGITAVWLTTLLLLYGRLRQVWAAHADQWLLLAGFAMVYCLWVVWHGLVENHRSGEQMLLATLGWGNRLTLMRGLVISMVAGFLFSPWPQGALAWLPVLLYTVADVADYLDGYTARVTNHATKLGERLDMEYDGLGMLIVSFLAVWYRQLPWWYLILGLARYLFVLGIWWRQRRGLPIYDLQPSVHRRIFAGFQMGFMSAVLWPILPPDGATIAGTLFAVPTALGFLRDWLVVNGRLDPTHPTYKRTQQWLVTATRRWAPPVLRILLLISMVGMYSTIANWIRPLPWQLLLQSWGVPGAPLLAALLGIVGLIGLLMVSVGAVGRLMSLALVFPIGFDIASQGVNWATGVALGCAICLMLLGTGPGSLWPVDE
ncbi:MAG: CDP-alcohol phosphatidyltransferase family protein, partial [Anaerolineales bacterium]|nr:CDP-alcohol phosphatidyltransferase family protein [Anaerolineales bacterium]